MSQHDDQIHEERVDLLLRMANLEEIVLEIRRDIKKLIETGGPLPGSAQRLHPAVAVLEEIRRDVMAGGSLPSQKAMADRCNVARQTFRDMVGLTRRKGVPDVIEAWNELSKAVNFHRRDPKNRRNTASPKTHESLDE